MCKLLHFLFRANIRTPITCTRTYVHRGAQTEHHRNTALKDLKECQSHFSMPRMIFISLLDLIDLSNRTVYFV